MRIRSLLAPIALSALACVPAAAQSLRGSPASVERMYRQAREHDLHFFRTGRGVREAAEEGTLVRMSGNRDYRVADAAYPYVLPTTRTFVQRLGRQYRAECGERLVVTSGARPRSLRLRNSAGDRSVHAAGMAVDLRKPARAACLRWLRSTLLAVESRGAIEAIEERHPPHFHVAIFPGPYRRYVSAAERGEGARSASATSRRRAAEPVIKPASQELAERRQTRYRVRSGDTLWSIARRHGTSVDRLRNANDLRSERLQPGQTLVIPAR
jgi:nucleoid-associated protein YgaU